MIALIKEKYNRIRELKINLRKTDYKAIKFAEGELSEEEYTLVRVERKAWRAEINALEAEIAELLVDNSTN